MPVASCSRPGGGSYQSVSGSVQPVSASTVIQTGMSRVYGVTASLTSAPSNSCNGCWVEVGSGGNITIHLTRNGFQPANGSYCKVSWMAYGD